MRQSGRLILGAVLVCVTLCATSARGVILYAKSDRNTRPPHGSLVESGWQWQGHFGAFLGTPIARQYFITSGHIRGEPGQPFLFNGQTFTTTAFYDDPASDLRIWKVDGDFKTFAPVFKDKTEVGRSCILFGRGTQRGEAVFQNGQLKGWQWDESDGARSWGRNSLVGVIDGGPQRGELLYFNFDQFGNAHEGTLSAGDSGGGVFVRQGSRWKLAGINTSVDGPYAYGAGQNPFNAALFDKGGMYIPRMDGGQTISDSVSDIPASAYVTRISSKLDWINGVLSGQVAPGGTLPDSAGGGIPEPTGAVITISVLAAMTLTRFRFGRRR